MTTTCTCRRDRPRRPITRRWQRADRRSELERLVHNLHLAHRLGAGVTQQRALTLLLVLSSYDTFRELREGDLSDREATKLLQDTARRLLLES
jgi:hypothetical protein